MACLCSLRRKEEAMWYLVALQRLLVPLAMLLVALAARPDWLVLVEVVRAFCKAAGLAAGWEAARAAELIR